jgi:subtilisin family serine protease/PKD repeat protein
MLKKKNHYVVAVFLVSLVVLTVWMERAEAVAPIEQQKGAKGAEPASAPRHRPDELLVKFREGVSDAKIGSIVQAHGGGEAKKFKRSRHQRSGAAIERWRQVKLSPGKDLEKTCDALRKHPAVERVEPNFEVTAALTPNDPRFVEQWALHNTGQTGGSVDADIDAPEGWDYVTGSNDIIVAVIDTGVDYTHPDLAGNLWTNPGEIPGNGVDDDGNGYVDDVYGYDFQAYDSDPFDDHGHGTHVAGTIAAASDNATGVAGVAWRARVMSVKFLGANGSGWISDAVNAVLYASDMGARVMNNSWGGGGYSQALYDAIAAANELGILFVAAAGNYSSDNDIYPLYPASYELPNVAAVAAGNKYDDPAWFSSYGRKSVLLAAPGQDILSTVPAAGNSCCSDPSGYMLLSGTSMATPHVSGAAALLLSQDPARTAANLKPLLMATVDWAAAGVLTRSAGRLNVHKAVSCDTGVLRLQVETPYHGFLAYTGEPFPIVALVHACGYPVTGADVRVTFNTGDPEATLFDDGNHSDGAANDGVYGGSWVPQNIGSPMALYITATDSARGSVMLNRSGTVRHRQTYRFENAPFAWIDPSAGTRPAFNWYGSAALPLDFGFEFYGQIYTTLFVNRDGYLSVYGPANDVYWTSRFPDSEIPNGMIAPYWMRFNSTPDARVYVLPEDTAPNRRLTVGWINMQQSDGTPVSFEVTLYEGTNDIRFQYLQMPAAGGAAAVGVEDQNGTEGTQHSFFTPVLQNGTAIRFYPGPFNHKPVANPGGPYTGFPEQAIAFDGTGSTDAENDALTYRWDFGDGTTATGPTPTHTYAVKGTYTVTLTVSDGIHDSLPVTTTAMAQNRPPVAAMTGPATGLRAYAVHFDTSGSYDPDGDIIERRLIDWGDGTPVTDFGRLVDAYHVYNVLGTFTITFRAGDAQAESAPVTRTVTIQNQPPIANAGIDYTVTSRSKAILAASQVSDPDGTIVQTQWRQVSGQTVTIVDANTSYAYFYTPNVKGGSQLILEFEFTVTDNDGAQASDRKIITVVK